MNVEEKKIPEGFKIAYFNLDKTPNFDYALFIQDGEEYIFYVKDVTPKLPFKEINGMWADHKWIDFMIDSDNNCWFKIDSYSDSDSEDHSEYNSVSRENLVLKIENEEDQNKLRQMLGLEIPMPKWAQTAISQGFSPPNNWTWEK
jgi:hypothetical protein